jgi:Domain of unknown function (DUF6983)
MSSQIVPLQSLPNQTSSVQLTVNGSVLTLGLTVSYDAMAGWWTMSIADSSGNQLIASVPLITGYYPAANLLAQYQYLQIGSAYLLNTGNAPIDYPGEFTLGLFSLLWDDNAD